MSELVAVEVMGVKVLTLVGIIVFGVQAVLT